MTTRGCDDCGEPLTLDHRCEVREANVTISLRVMEEMFFPKGTKVMRVLPPDPHMDSRCFNVTVRHESLDPIKEGQTIPTVWAECHKDERGIVTNTRFVK